jgi:putative addiction module CopG family antidote
MHISLTARSEAMVRDWIERGHYADPSAAVEEALHLLDRRNRLEWLRAAVAEAEAEVERGEVVEWTPDFFDRLKEEAAEDARRGVPIPDEVKP